MNSMWMLHFATYVTEYILFSRSVNLNGCENVRIPREQDNYVITIKVMQKFKKSCMILYSI